MNSLIEQFGNEKRWVNWVYKLVDDKQTKVPLGSSNKPETWSTYKKLPNKQNIGIMFGTDHTFLGIDIDHCVENGEIVHEEKDKILALIDQADTYTELSPSKTGIHIYLDLSSPLELITHRKSPFECYTALRFFTVTGESFGDNKIVRTITPAEALSLLSIIGYPWGKNKKTEQIKNTNIIPQNLDDDKILEKMFSSKNGDKMKLIYNGDISNHKNNHSSADLAFCSSLAFWTGRNYSQIERIWLNSPLGNREKTQKRQDYRERTINEAIAGCKEIYTAIPEKKIRIQINEDEYEDIEFDFLFKYLGVKEPRKVITLCTENISKVLRKHPEFIGRFRFDEFKMVIEYKAKDKWEQFTDKDILFVQQRVATLFDEFQTVKKDMVYDAIAVVAHENTMDSAIDYIKSIEWDGVNRLDTWLTETYGVEDNIYHRSAGSNWIKGLVKRICRPGCKFDYVLVLEGEQGTKKSSSLGILGGDWHVETTMDTDSKDFFMQFAAKAIVEFSEGETLSKTEVKRMKAIITTQVDKYRAPYERVSLDHPRRCVFAMTTNTSEYLKDETGNRRWWPIATVLPQANLEWLKENRDQLFAEAYQRVIINEESTWEMPEEETMSEQAARRISDPNAEMVSEWYYGKLTEQERLDGITIHQVYIDCYGNNFGKKNLNKYEEMNIASILKDYLKLEKKRSMVNGIQAIRWFEKNIESVYTKDIETIDSKFKQF